jgi:hypothetical protein
MADYITPYSVDTNAFMLATSVNRNKLFGPKLKPRGDRLIAIDVALKALKDNYQPQGNAEQTRGFLLLVIREARNWLRNMRSKADAGNLGTTAREYKRLAIRKLVAEATDALVACTPGFANAMQAYARQKRGGAMQFQMKGLSGVYAIEGNLYRAGGKSQGKTLSATVVGNAAFLHGFRSELGPRARNNDIRLEQKKANGLGFGSDVTSMIENMMRGDVLFENFSEGQFETFGRFVEARYRDARVVYLSKMERLQHLKQVRNGMLYNIDGTVYATTEINSGTSWAMDCYGNLFVGDKKISDVQVNHSSYLAGKDVACAGLIMTAADGTVTEIDNSSGHYKPTKEHLHDALRYLADQGLNFERAIVRVVGSNDTETKYRASAWIRNISAPALGNRQFTLGGNR